MNASRRSFVGGMDIVRQGRYGPRLALTRTRAPLRVTAPARQQRNLTTERPVDKAKTTSKVTRKVRKKIVDPWTLSDDPHALANERIRKSVGRAPGTEAMKTVDADIKYRNYAMATMMIGFVAAVWYYSMSAVGRADDDTFRQEAQEAKDKHEAEALQAEQDGLMAVDYDDNEEDYPDDVESEMQGSDSKEAQRPLWKRIILSWR